ncbi:MAG: prolipoprotein diacylglyceryl transferase [Bacteroidia bacterium]|nr:prolipoprotein diacylglyceryl transferase [Bacteroidia bacterium]
MYPTLYDAIKDIFGWDIPALKIVMMFGFFVALGFLAANWAMTSELKRREKNGEIKPFKRPVSPPNPTFEYIQSAILGFLFGFKLIYMFTNLGSVVDNPQEFLISFQGSWLWGIIATIAFVGYKYYQLKKLPQIEEGATELFHPYMMMGNLTLIAAVAGFAGAKLFHHLEHFSDLIKDPMVIFEDIFSGLTFFGGLIAGGAAVLWYANKHGVKWRTMLDVGGPAMMLAYGVGRMGCHTSGDGDWGIENLAPKPDWLSWLPDWAWAYDYPNNVHGWVLENPVWPTPLYEVIMALIIFGILWGIRKKPFPAGVLFSIYLIFAGIERFLIEKIRVNPDQFEGLSFTQAEIISSVMVLLGIAGIVLFYRSEAKKKPLQNEAA